MIEVGKEDGLIEYLTFFFFLGTSFLFLKTYLVSKNKYFLLLALVFFLGAGEEISWGQRIFSFTTPEIISDINVQKEFNLHNIEIFNGHDFEHNAKQGFDKLLSINFLYKLFWLFFGVIFPTIILFIKKIPFMDKLKLKFPPLSIGLFFIVNWGTMKILEFVYFTPFQQDYPIDYHYSVGEVMESGTAFIFLVISYYFFSTEKLKMVTDLR